MKGVERGFSALESGDVTTAARIAGELLARPSPDASSLYLKGQVERALRGPAAALPWLWAAARSAPPPMPWLTLGQCLSEVGDFHGALDALGRAASLCPNNAEVQEQRARLQRHLGQYEAARASYRRALRANPDNAVLNLGMATLLHFLRETDSAEPYYRKALQSSHGHPDVRWEYAMQCLLRGDYGQGWEHYDVRVTHFPQRASIHPFPGPRWMGEPLAGKTLLVHGEQGFGDQIMFAGLLPEIIEEAAKVIVAVPDSLVALFRHSFPEAVIETLPAFKAGAPLPDWIERYRRIDFQSPIGSLARWRRQSMESFGVASAYLSAPPELVNELAIAMDRVSPPEAGVRRIGLVWQGNPDTGEMGLRKSLPLGLLAPLARATDCAWLSLQPGQKPWEKPGNPAPRGIRIQPMGAHLKSFAHTAAVIDQLDLVISVDTAVAHLAGAMGKPIWLLLWHAADWRYLEQADTSHWYADMRLFRQRKAGDWLPVVEQVLTALR